MYFHLLLELTSGDCCAIIIGLMGLRSNCPGWAKLLDSTSRGSSWGGHGTMVLAGDVELGAKNDLKSTPSTPSSPIC